MYRTLALVGLSSPLCPLSFPKDKSVLPADVLSAQTVLVVIEPDAGEPLTNPGANSGAREDVEHAITKWGAASAAGSSRRRISEGPPRSRESREPEAAEKESITSMCSPIN